MSCLFMGSNKRKYPDNSSGENKRESDGPPSKSAIYVRPFVTLSKLLYYIKVALSTISSNFLIASS